MNWNQLRYVLTIAEEKSITRAAQRLYLTQPSLSLSLKALDDLRGQVLNDMKGEELSEALTAYGASLEHNLSRCSPAGPTGWSPPTRAACSAPGLRRLTSLSGG